jgi:hypothetical protein
MAVITFSPSRRYFLLFLVVLLTHFVLNNKNEIRAVFGKVSLSNYFISQLSLYNFPHFFISILLNGFTSIRKELYVIPKLGAFQMPAAGAAGMDRTTGSAELGLEKG